MRAKISVQFLFIISGIMIFNFTISAQDIYVSPRGDDSNPGTKNQPFLTLMRAQEEIFKDGEKDYTIWLAEGCYEIEEPLIFNADRFGATSMQISIKAEKGAKPVISGGTKIIGWNKNKNGIWEADYKHDKAPRELFVGEKRAIRARFPNKDHLRVKKVGKDRRTHFFFAKDDFPVPDIANKVELVVLHDWSISRIAVKDIDFKKHKLTAVDSIGAKSPAFFNLDHWEKHPRYFLENDLVFLDADFEWYYDSKKEKVYLKLPENRTPKDLPVIAPVSEGLVQIKGKQNKRIKNISFKGISFQHSAWYLPEMGYCGIQACHFDSRPKKEGWSVVPAAVKTDWGENISFVDCTFKNLGASGLWFSTGSRNCTVDNSEFSDISGNGIMIGEGRDRLVEGTPWWQKAPENAARGNSVRNCLLTKCGEQFYGAVGIWCGLTANTTIQNNRIYNLPYSGISIGWMWSPVPTPCRDNVIDGNHIHHIMNKLSDGGGIYMLGLQPGSRLVNNHIHDVKLNAGRAESNGMFLDEGTSDVLVANNLIYSIAKSPLRFHKAATNLVKENYLFCTGENPPIRYNSTRQEDIQKENNFVFYDSEENYSKQLEQIIKRR